ncbi:4-hydroxy-tetrahydrodipicolinate synthase [Magnetospira sp. QH-2]|uniref:4-hydroxy-tetrahydrodipicolinate synthase n=1 Tax=Magnetospira sp. (strain QH-2) TaxID=1288970 RepID=UPI0003E81278|nr:4-hydroxy-tetrahydrodipicolinate synthase [Magnetospira sp. QH-2]CCQ72135.1 Dihydrodipicolinate synthase [Magnetospira sp. QH-2]
MPEQRRLDGVFTALVTPFTDRGDIDWSAFDALIDRQLQAGISGLLPVGTTGEAATLSEDEAVSLIERTVKRVDGQAYVLAGTGSNATDKAVKATRRAADVGVDGVLLVTPYYNKPSQRGLVAHFQAIADCAAVDNVLYSVPGRAGIAIEPETAAELCQSRTNIVALKEAGGDPARVTALRAACGPSFAIHCGDDGLALPFYALGASGLTSVLANFDPEICVALYQAWQSGDHQRALALHEILTPFARALFIESSPAPVKAAMALRAWVGDTLRLPLVPMGQETLALLVAALNQYAEDRGRVMNA